MNKMKRIKPISLKKDLLAKHPDLYETFYSTAALYGKIIFARRMELGLTQMEVAKDASFSVKTFSRAEAGSGNIGTETYDSIFKKLGLTTADVAKLMVEFTDEQVATTVLS